MIPALICVGVLGLSVGVGLGVAVGGILGSEQVRKACAARNRAVFDRDQAVAEKVAMTASRNWWRSKATRLEAWLPQEIVSDVLMHEETA